MASTGTTVRQLGIDDDLLSATTLSDVTYADAHVLETFCADRRTADQWARIIMEDVSEADRNKLTAAWASLGLDLAPGTDGTVAGWRIRSSEPKCLLLQANSSLGFQGELVFDVSENCVHLATFVAISDSRARDVWFPMVPAHLGMVRSLLERAEHEVAP